MHSPDGLLAAQAGFGPDLSLRQEQPVLQAGFPGQAASLGTAQLKCYARATAGITYHRESVELTDDRLLSWTAVFHVRAGKFMHWVAFHNRSRLHSALGYLSPI